MIRMEPIIRDAVSISVLHALHHGCVLCAHLLILRFHRGAIMRKRKCSELSEEVHPIHVQHIKTTLASMPNAMVAVVFDNIG